MKMKKAIVCFTSVAMMGLGVSYAGQTGMYFGGQIGQARMDSSSQNASSVNSVTGAVTPISITPKKNTGMAGRLFLGYQISKYAAMETGFGIFSSVDFKPDTAFLVKPSVSSSVLDFAGKAILPVQDQFELYAKLGAAYTMVKASGFNPTATVSSGIVTIKSSSERENKMRPEIGIGATYYFNPNWSLDASATRIMAKSYVKNLDLFAVGISYHLVDHYCGQFLCDSSDK